MKKLLILALDHFTDDQVFSWPVKHLGAVVEVYGGNVHPDAKITQLIEQHKPDVVVWSGVCGGESMPNQRTLGWIKGKARSVMICWDAGHRDWHPHLAEYAKHDTFDLVCGVDGSFDWPRRKQDLPCLCPINPEWYDHGRDSTDNRPVDLGFVGSYDADSHRGRVLEALGNLVTVRRRTGEPGAYKDYADFMLSCKATVNVANSAGDGPMHVKARCVEAAWAGCMLFESKDSPLYKWPGFTPNYNYIEYEEPWEIAEWIKQDTTGAGRQGYGEKLREAMQPHHPRHFWQQVLGN